MSKKEDHIKNKRYKNQKPKNRYAQITAVVFKNFIVAIILISFLSILSTKNIGYKWVRNKLIKGNNEMISQYGNLTIDQKHEVKQGFYYKYLKFIVDNTPNDAIILMPSDSVIDSVDKKYRLAFLKDRQKTSYFIYPRKPIFRKNTNTDSLYFENISHVAIVNYMGYENLDYKILKKQKFTILPKTNRK